ncbi:MAG: hypothetical protein ACPHXR_04985 [Flavicella sp.]
MAGCSMYLYNKISESPTIDFQKISHFIPILMLLSFFNWGLEFLKWKLLVTTETNINIKEAAQQCLIAHTAGIVTPNKIGEYGAKAFLFKDKNPKKIMLLNGIANGYQMIVTLLFGLIGILYCWEHWIQLPFELPWIPILIGGLVVFLCLIYKTGWVKKILCKLNAIATNTHLKTLGLSTLRYLLFSSQFLLLLVLLANVNDYYKAYALIWVLYLSSSLIPSFALVEFTVKGSLALHLFTSLQISATSIVATIFLMWTFNYALPALVGIFYTLQYKSTQRYGTAID